MTPIDLAAVEKAAKEATPGPWEADSFGLYVFGPSEKGGTFPVADTDDEKPGSVARIRGWGYFTGHGQGALKLSQEEAAKRQKANADFIALANPATILALCERIREPAKVKPLEWPDSIKQGQRVKSSGGLLSYTIVHYGGSEPDSGTVFRWGRENGGWSEAFFAYEHAITDAQADYASRIRSALITNEGIVA